MHLLFSISELLQDNNEHSGSARTHQSSRADRPKHSLNHRHAFHTYTNKHKHTNFSNHALICTPTQPHKNLKLLFALFYSTSFNPF